MAQHQLHLGARWIFRVKVYGVMLFLLPFFLSWFFFFLMGIFLGVREPVFVPGMTGLAALFFLLLVAALGEIYARLSYHYWKYEFTTDTVRIERGIIWKRYSSIPYGRIQNVDIHRGIIARLCGFSQVIIQTAGYSTGGSYSPFAEGNIPAVEMAAAEKMRTLLLQKINKRSKGRKQGL